MKRGRGIQQQEVKEERGRTGREQEAEWGGWQISLLANKINELSIPAGHFVEDDDPSRQYDPVTKRRAICSFCSEIS
jgi:hypothetical protein